MNEEPKFGAKAGWPGTRCPVVKCDWRTKRKMWEPGGTVDVDEHMVVAHPETEWARRVAIRRGY